MGKKKLSTNWYVHHQGRMEWYESQSAAIDAVDLFVASYENGIWNDRTSYLSLGHADGETVDRELFKLRGYTNSLIRSEIGSIFSINIFSKTKEDWIFRYGSALLQQSVRAGYECHDGYLAERLACDYPNFTINDRKYPKVDTPDRHCLHACSQYEYAHCSLDRGNYYITIDDYLGKYQLIQLIDASLEITTLADSIEAVDDKAEWIFEYGSNLLQQSFLAGYVCNDRYLQERVDRDYPGFKINPEKYQQVDSPSETCLYACLGYEQAYCSAHDRDDYITIDDFLGKYQLIKLIDVPTTQISYLDYPARAVNRLLENRSIKLKNSLNSIASDLTIQLDSFQLISVCTISGTLMYVTIEYLPKIFQAIWQANF